MLRLKRRTDDPLQWGDPRCATMTCALYMRKSTATEGRSKSREEQFELNRMDAERFGFSRIEEYLEPEGRRGEWWWRDRKGHNPPPYREELTRMVEDIEAGEIQTVVVYKLNRLVRDSGVHDALVKLFRRYKVRLIEAGRDVELDTARGKSNAALEAARAAEFRDQIEEDIERDLDFKFLRGQFTRNPSCYGWRSKGRGSQAVIHIPEEIANVRTIFSWFLGLDGGRPLGVHQIAQRCMKEGMRIAVGAKGHKVNFPDRVRSNQIRSILGNPMYIGEWQHNRQRKPYPQLLIVPEDGFGEPQPVVAPDVWYAAEAKLAERVRVGKKAATSQRLLAGLVICGACGQPCHVNVHIRKSGIKRERWICPRREGIDRSCWGASYGSVLVDQLDRWIVDYAAPMLALEIDDIVREGQDGSLRREFEALNTKLEQTKELETHRLKQAISVLDETQFAAVASSLREDRIKLLARIDELRSLVKEDDRRIPTDPQALLATNPTLLQDALARSLYWIALTDKGVVAFTKLKRPLAGRYKSRPNEQKVRQGRTVAPPDFDTLDECESWFVAPDQFIAGRRYSLGEAASRLSDTELFPFSLLGNGQEKRGKKGKRAV